MVKKVKTRKKKSNGKMDLLDEYLYVFKSCNDGKLPHEKFKDLPTIIYYYNLYYERNEKLSIKEYLLHKVLPYAEEKNRKKLVDEILSVVEATDEEILERAIEVKFRKKEKRRLYIHEYKETTKRNDNERSL